MYTPLFNSVLVEIDDQSAGWNSNSDAMLGDSYSKGVVVEVAGDFVPTGAQPLDNADGGSLDIVKARVNKLKGKHIMWNEGVEAGTTWDEDGKKYGFIYWWDVRGVKDDDGN